MPGGIRAKIALALVLVIGVAQAAAYLLVVPTLERALVGARIDQLRKDAGTLATALAVRDASQPLTLQSFVDVSAAGFNTRVVVLGVLNPPLTLTRVADSFEEGSDEIARSPVALRAARTGQVSAATVRRAGGEYAEVAVPLLTSSGVLMVSSSLSDQLGTIRLVERRFLVATLAAVGIALALGSVAAAMHARRIRRLERAANRIAEGHFDEPIADTGDDELGQLAAAFDRMRLQLAQLDMARKEFVANASHELRTPLFSLAGFLELLDDEELDEETRRRFLTTTREQVDRLTRLAGDLLDLSRVDAGRIRIEQEEVDLHEVVSVLFEEVQPLADATGHRVTLDADDSVWATADEERVMQASRALLSNALTHTPSGTTVTLGTRISGDRAVVVVADDGPGIPPEHVARVFDRFYRVEGGQASGSGLGLAIARELALRMNGTVSVETRPGRTVFTLTLPAVVLAPADDPAVLAGR